MRVGVRPRGSGRAGAVLVAAVVLLGGCSSDLLTTTAPAGESPGTAGEGGGGTGISEDAANVDPALVDELARLSERAVSEYDLMALLVKVTQGGRDVYEAAFGETMTGVPATTDMHFRNGAFAFTYIGQAFARMADEGLLSLEDPLSTWRPDLPEADRITIRMLLNMTSGYADYVYTPDVLDGTQADPFRQWTGPELTEIGVSRPMWFEPGTNWAYSHTNYVILGDVLSKITGRSTAEALEEYVVQPMGLTQTTGNDDTPLIPEPVLQSYTSERRTFLQVPADVPFYEDSTYWNPSWTTAPGAVQTSTIDDVTRSMEIVGSGAQVSPEMYEQQTGANLVGQGTPPTEQCPRCGPLTEERNYGLGVIRYGPWIANTKLFAGSGATGGYLPEGEWAITVVTTYLPSAFGPDGGFDNASATIWAELAAAVSPDNAPRV